MSCSHPERTSQTRTTTLNRTTEQTERVCGRCGAVLDVEIEEVRG